MHWYNLCYDNSIFPRRKLVLSQLEKPFNLKRDTSRFLRFAVIMVIYREHCPASSSSRNQRAATRAEAACQPSCTTGQALRSTPRPPPSPAAGRVTQFSRPLRFLHSLESPGGKETRNLLPRATELSAIASAFPPRPYRHRRSPFASPRSRPSWQQSKFLSLVLQLHKPFSYSRIIILAVSAAPLHCLVLWLIDCSFPLGLSCQYREVF